MSFNSIGDLAQAIQLRRETARLNSDLQRLAGQVASGQKADVIEAVRGDFRVLAGLEQSLTALDAFEVTVNEATLAAESGQAILDRIATDSIELSSSLLLVQEASDVQLTAAAAADARQVFASSVTGLNTIVAGRTLFAGQAFDGPALDDPETILADLNTALVAETTAAGVLTAIDTFFAPGGPFETTSYLGSADPADPVSLGNGMQADPFLSATDREIVEVLKSQATAAVMDLGILAGNPEERAELARTTGERLVTAESNLVVLRADLGAAEERIETARTRIGAERSSFELAKLEILQADPLDSVAQLRQAEGQLESLFLITGRLYNLTLANYLR